MHLQDTKSSPIATNEYCTSTISGDTLPTFLREPQVTDYVKWCQLLRCLKMVCGMGLVRLQSSYSMYIFLDLGEAVNMKVPYEAETVIQIIVRPINGCLKIDPIQIYSTRSTNSKEYGLQVIAKLMLGTNSAISLIQRHFPDTSLTFFAHICMCKTLKVPKSPTNEYCTSTISGDTEQAFLREPQVTDYVKWLQLLRCLKTAWGMGLVGL
ncbi:hypothetical protein CDAR_369521 [Caerostris darwini]|uniref:Uncharacterized protein n=1 Tax=Caerostris darwini TaxID=1538125 RepID=A0AAV4RXM3_9ARAC|nr:hypothetical protein CDAR_369521 [Caerostris darwini]